MPSQHPSHILRYVYGDPVSTGAVVCELPVTAGDPAAFSVRHDGTAVSFSLDVEPEDLMFGLGQSVRGMNKRGHIYRSWNTDDVMHVEEKESLYGSYNFLIITGPERTLALFLDDPGEITWDLCHTSLEQVVITSLNGDLNLYVMEDCTPAEACHDLRLLTGPSYLPPLWGFGYIQSRWGYASREDLEKVVRGHRDRGIPLDGVCMDIDYMDRYRNFTWNREKIPDLAALVRDMKKEHIHLVPIIDAGIPVDENDAACRSGLENDSFVRREDGTLFQAAVWPGLSYFTDYLNTRARAWFGSLYRPMLEAGIDGFWNDMNEPSLFYSPEGMARAYEIADEMRGKNLDLNGNWRLQSTFQSLANSRQDYASFYHDMDGRKVRHDKVHNLYGFGMTRASMEGMHAYDPDRRFLLFTRSSYIGGHRYGGMWMGDNRSWWSHLKLNLQMLPGLNMCGFLYCGADLGGFGSDVTGDLLLRWLELGIFTPLMRNHSSTGTREQEIYQFKNWEDMCNIITCRYLLLPYIYSEFMKAALDGGLYFRPLAFDYPDDRDACHVDDQLMLGGDCMIAPVYEPNAIGRSVYLPEDMLLVRLISIENLILEPMNKGYHFLPVALNEAILFVKRGHVIPLADGHFRCTDDLAQAQLSLLGWLGEKEQAGYELYTDDGRSYAAGKRRVLRSDRVDGSYILRRNPS